MNLTIILSQRIELYQDWLIPNGGRYTAGGCIYRDDYNHAHVAIHHFSGRKPFDNEKLKLLKLFMPHMVQCMKIWMQSENLHQATQLSQFALDKLQYGLLPVTTKGKACFVNRTAEALLIKMKGEFKHNHLAAHGSLWTLMQRCLLQGPPLQYTDRHRGRRNTLSSHPCGKSLPEHGATNMASRRSRMPTNYCRIIVNIEWLSLGSLQNYLGSTLLNHAWRTRWHPAAAWRVMQKISAFLSIPYAPNYDIYCSKLANPTNKT